VKHRLVITASEQTRTGYIKVTFGCSCPEGYAGDQTVGKTPEQARVNAQRHVDSHAGIARHGDAVTASFRNFLINR
jgi:hypothetical protein